MRMTDYGRSRRVTVAVKLTEAMAHELREAAARDERTVSAFLRKLIERAV